MPSPADRFSRLQKVAIFLIALGQERARECLVDVDLATLECLDAAIQTLGPVSAEEKAAVMLEFADFFFADKPLPEAPRRRAGRAPAKTPSAEAPSTPTLPGAPAAPGAASQPPPAPAAQKGAWPTYSRKPPMGGRSEPRLKPEEQEEQATRQALDRLRQRVDPGKIDWGRAGYDFGEGFKGPDQGRR